MASERLENCAATDYYINCPFEREAGEARLELKLRAVNETNGPLDLKCSFKEHFGGTYIQERSRTATLDAEGYAELIVEMKPTERDSAFNAACLLSKGIAVETTSVGFAPSCSYDNFAGGWSYTMAYGYDGAEIGIGFFDDEGNITGQTDDGQSTRDVTGFYDVAANECTFQAELRFSNGVNVRVAGFLSEDQNSLIYVARNSYGYFTNGTMARLAGVGARGRGSLGRIASPRLGLHSNLQVE